MDLIADIGGTNARFALVEHGRVVSRMTLPTQEFASTRDVLSVALRDAQGPPGSMVLAVAGPVAGGLAELTNGHWKFDTVALARWSGCADVVLINDFYAAALAVPGLEDTDLRSLGGPPRPGPDTRVILGPGTGLGTAAVVPVNNGWMALPGEGGHAALAPADALEVELLGLLQQRFDPVTWEHVISGPGLVNLYTAVCALWGTAPQLDSPEAVVAAALDNFDPVCDQTLGTFCNLLASVAGNLLVTLKANGGVYIAGGLALRLGDFMAASHFRRRFEERGAMTDMARATATLLVLADDVGLRGALAELRRRLQEPS